MTTTVFVIGAGGYIGEGIALAFRRHGYKVYGLVRNPKASSFLLKNEIIPVIGDLNNIDSWKSILQSSSIIVDAVGYNTSSKTNIDLIAQAVSKDKLRKPLFIFTSGIMTNEDVKDKIIDETYVPQPTKEVMKNRKAFEEYVLSLTNAQESNLRTAVIRPGFVYGKGGGFVCNFLFDVKKEEDLVIYGSRTKRWSWVHVDDLGESYVALAKAGKNANGELFNIGELNAPTFEELQIACARAGGWDSNKNKVIYKTAEESQGKFESSWEGHVVVNSQKASDLLGWKSRHVGIVEEIDIYYNSWKSSKTL